MEDEWTIQRKKRECQRVLYKGHRRKTLRNQEEVNSRSPRHSLHSYVFYARAGVNARPCITPLQRQGVLPFCRVRMTRTGNQRIDSGLVCAPSRTRQTSERKIKEGSGRGSERVRFQKGDGASRGRRIGVRKKERDRKTKCERIVLQ